MGILPQSNGKDELILVFHIGSSSVGGAFFLSQSSGAPKIIFSVREQVAIEQDINIDRFLFLTMQALETVVNKVYSSGAGAPSRIFCVLSSPWYVSQTRMINMERNTPFIFTEKLADGLIQKEINIFEKEHLAQYLSVGQAVRTIELKNIRTMLNGYETAKPINQKAQSLEMAIFISIAAESVLKNIEETIGQHFHFKQIQFSSFVLASFAVVRDMYVKQGNFLLVDIGGEVTDISMIKKNILHESISFPLGRNFLIRGVASSLGCGLTEASSFISLFKDGHADENTSKKLAPIIDQLKAEWLKKFQESMANLSHDISIPATIYIAIDKDLADFFAETIKTEQFNQYTLTESKFEVIFLSTELLHGIASFEEAVIREPFLIIDSVYINRFFSKI